MTEFDDAADLLKALADPTRLRLVRALLEAPSYVEALATGLGVAAPTVSHHLKKLEDAGLVERRREQYYTMVHVLPGLLDRRLRDLVEAAGDDRSAEDRRLEAYRQRILGTFFRDGHLVKLPAQRKKRLVVLEAFAADFAPDRDYAEDEVNAVIVQRCADYCTVRRELVDAGLMTRPRPGTGPQRYRLAAAVDVAPLPVPGPRKDTDMPLDRDARKHRVELYKQAVRQAGIYGIRNLRSGRLLLGSALNLHGPLNRHRAQLGFGSHPCPALQADWNELGPEAFSFEVFDTVDPELQGPERDAALKALEQEWIANLQPFGDRCYNTSGDIRRRAF
ncbi:MAG: metalloregulator ArsR/SmtB family transcription factor [Krumholzibacteria bacterium]|nr:metalloregulator ArsR/SmtB family transcription factor [Candidatus Krumholzibacteria bacterium]